jgi:hypothetical protein
MIRLDSVVLDQTISSDGCDSTTKEVETLLIFQTPGTEKQSNNMLKMKHVVVFLEQC